MPSCCAAAQITAPFGARTGRPSIVRFTNSCCSVIAPYIFRGTCLGPGDRSRFARSHSRSVALAVRAGTDEAGVGAHMVDVLVAPQPDAADDAAGGGVTQRTERLTRDI